MRSRFVVCAALAGIGLLGAWSPAQAADPKAKSGKKKSGDGLSDDKVIDKQLQWEDSVMGPDDKRGELDKIARAQAINKAASEKAERDKEKAAAAAAKEPPAPKAQTNKRGGEVALPTLPDEDSGNGNKASKGKTSEISPKLETTAAAAPPPPVKHGDDKFIDKLLKDEPSSKKKKVSASDDKELDDLLAVGKPAKPVAKGKGKRGDDVDSLLDSADKAPPMPETKVKHETPEWAKPEIESAPAAAPVVVRPQPKRDDGIIHVVQGAAPTGRPAAAPSRAQVGTRPASFATRTPAPAPALSPAARRQQTPARPAGWNDPFADGPKKAVAARETRGSIDDDDVAPAPSRRRAAAAPPSVAKAEPSRSARGARSSDRGSDNDWSDPFKDSPKTTNTRRAAPAAKPAEPPARRGAWKDPFTEETRGSHPAHAAVAMREPRKGESTKWEVAEKKSAPAVDAASPVASTRGRWGVLKKRAR
jgi:hypothetical protein